MHVIGEFAIFAQGYVNIVGIAWHNYKGILWRI